MTKKVAILYICTGKYVLFWDIFFPAAEKYFLPQVEKHYFVFTDMDISHTDVTRVHRIQQENLGWPGNTLKRFHIFSKIKEKLQQFDFIYFINSNMIPQDYINEEILPSEKEGLVVTTHPGFYNEKKCKFSYDRNSKCQAYVPQEKGNIYICGGFNGGRTNDYIQMIYELKNAIDIDEKNGIIALWHDESHLNKYILTHSYKLLSPAYAYPEGWNLPFSKKIIILDKNKFGGHDFLRGTNTINQSFYSIFYKKLIIIKNYILRKICFYKQHH